MRRGLGDDAEHAPSLAPSRVRRQAKLVARGAALPQPRLDAGEAIVASPNTPPVRRRTSSRPGPARETRASPSRGVIRELELVFETSSPLRDTRHDDESRQLATPPPGLTRAEGVSEADAHIPCMI